MSGIKIDLEKYKKGAKIPVGQICKTVSIPEEMDTWIKNRGIKFSSFARGILEQVIQAVDAAEDKEEGEMEITDELKAELDKRLEEAKAAEVITTEVITTEEMREAVKENQNGVQGKDTRDTQ